MKFRLRPFFKDILLTFFTQAIILIALIFVYRLIAQNFGPEGLGEYSLIKRAISFLQPILLLGLGVSIPRYIAISENKEERSGYMKSGGLALGVFTVFFLILINLFKEFFAKIFFGTIDYINFVLPLSFFLVGSILTAFMYSYFRGRLFVKTFNFLHIINLALVPFIIIIFFEEIAIEKLITLIGLITFLIAFIFFIFSVKEFFIFLPKWQIKKAWDELLKYGAPRLPGDFALAGLLSLGPIFAAHFVSIQEVGYLSVSQSLLYTVGAVMAPLGLVLLPKVSNLIANGKQEMMKDNLNFLIAAIIQCSVFLCVQSIIFADIIIKYWLGAEFLNAVPVMRIIFLSIFFYIFYVAIRSVLDAVKVKPLNTINLFMSLGVFLGISVILLLLNIFSLIISLSVAFTSGLICLGVLTYISVRKIYSENIKNDIYFLGVALAINIFLGGLAIFLKPFIVLKFHYLILFIVGIGLIYLLTLWLLKMKWIRQIYKIIFEEYVQNPN
jgi:O-antigen/teichoic acid export membrane protein